MDRKRVQDVYESLHEEVFPRLGAIDSKLTLLESGMTKVLIDGCPRRIDDLQRTKQVEEGMERIFDKIDGFGEVLSGARIDMVTQVGKINNDVAMQISNIRTWMLTAVVILLIAVVGYFVKAHFDKVNDHISVIAPPARTFFPQPVLPEDGK